MLAAVMSFTYSFIGLGLSIAGNSPCASPELVPAVGSASGVVAHCARSFITGLLRRV